MRHAYLGIRYSIVGSLLFTALQLRAQVPAPLQQPFPPQQALQQEPERADTLRPVPLPTEESVVFTPEQDSAYVHARRNPVPPLARFQAELRQSWSAWWEALQRAVAPPLQSALRNLRVEPSYLAPTGEELVQYAYALQQAQALPNPTGRRTPGSGIAIPWGTVAQLLGLAEDLSPTVRYEISTVTHVQVVVYSAQAILVAMLFDGLQPPGRYSLTWNGRDEHGRALPPGDYVAEVRIGNGHRLYKRIRLSASDVR
ncbi:MAG: hypothetical protein NZ949_02905 [Candidatus Kapabacteria bacterium]|nr:hypothetical protein [Candidatus Kapabacteria bacterium]MDW8225601.1 FlgD immunoglobulin-like domain containing protein [Bacteroidota bacterium]